MDSYFFPMARRFIRSWLIAHGNAMNNIGQGLISRPLPINARIALFVVEQHEAYELAAPLTVAKAVWKSIQKHNGIVLNRFTDFGKGQDLLFCEINSINEFDHKLPVNRGVVINGLREADMEWS